MLFSRFSTHGRPGPTIERARLAFHTQSVDVTIIIINNDFVILHHVPRFMMRFIDIFGACADSVYRALLFPPPREARASPYAGKIGTGDEAIIEEP